MFTSCFSRVHDLPDDLCAVSIARWPPRWWGKRPRCMALAPPVAALRELKQGTLAPGAFMLAYRRHLATLDLNAVVAELGSNTVMLCFCPPGAMCHRRVAAELMGKALGIEIPEWP